MAKKRALSGIRTSGELHLGNYLGALMHFRAMRGGWEGYYFLADLHGLTTVTDPRELQRSIIETAAMYIAVGLHEPETNHDQVIFRQSDISAHSEMAWLLNTIATMGELSRMTQFKDKTTGEARESVKVGLFDYPVLMAADILLYQPDTVPVGDDQKQHVELARDLAQRFNNLYQPVFKLPEPHVSKEGARIKGLDDPSKKMSKSAASTYNYIALKDDPDTIRRKISKAVTDSGSTIAPGQDRPAITNLLNIYSLMADRPISEVENQYADQGYQDFKADLAEVIIEGLRGIQETFAEASQDPGAVLAELAKGADKARPVAEATLAKAKSAMGL